MQQNPLEEHNKNKYEKEYQDAWKGNGKIFTGIKELYTKHEEQQKYFDSVLQIVDAKPSNESRNSN
ncbi:hypothetical protein ACNNMX_10370 [Aerococcus viridans]|uniref:hypothetical protein n=1 Tax=Aerococcus viridans TaxID=1377 RepID=UPI003AA8E3AC